MKLFKHLNIFKLINGSQHGFTKCRFFEKVTDAIDKGKSFDCIYLDFTKAFDKVSHFRLITKLKAHGGEMKMWQNGFFFLVNWKEEARGYSWRVLQLGKCY